MDFPKDGFTQHSYESYDKSYDRSHEKCYERNDGHQAYGSRADGYIKRHESRNVEASGSSGPHTTRNGENPLHLIWKTKQGEVEKGQDLEDRTKCAPITSETGKYTKILRGNQVTGSIGDPISVGDPVEQKPGMPESIAGEVVRQRDLRLPRAPSPPLPPQLCQSAARIDGIVPESETMIARPVTVQPTCIGGLGRTSKHRCSQCFLLIKQFDLMDQRNQNLKRREKKCVNCWDAPLQPVTKSAQARQTGPVAIDRTSTRHRSIGTLWRGFAHRSSTDAAIHAALQQMDTSATILIDENTQGEYWHVPFWLDQLPLLPPTVRLRAEFFRPL